MRVTGQNKACVLSVLNLMLLIGGARLQAEDRSAPLQSSHLTLRENSHGQPLSDADGSESLPLNKVLMPPEVEAIAPNYGVRTSLQSWLNAHALNVIPAYREIQTFLQQHPGQGETITVVGLADVNDRTTILRAGQRWIDVPSLPLIPTWVVGADGRLDPAGTTNDQDSALRAALLSFTLMAGLPTPRQRPERPGSLRTDLLGIAYGASFRLVVPKTPTAANIVTALRAAAQQEPRPTVILITLSIDAGGFPSRFLENDPQIRHAIQSIVHGMDIVVVVAAGDGTLFEAVGPNGGSAPTDGVREGERPTVLSEVIHSFSPSRLPDSGSIAVGAVTLNDISNAPPHVEGPLSGVLAFPVTRYNGSHIFSSGFGSRINVSAPGDPILAFRLRPGNPHDVVPEMMTGTGAAAASVAAAAAVVRQVAQLTGQPLTARRVRDILQLTGHPVPNPPQSPIPLPVGPQVDLTRAVEFFIGRQYAIDLNIPRISIAQRPTGQLSSLITVTDPENISLGGGLLNALITLAPDIEGLRRGDTFQFNVLNTGRMLSTSRFIRTTAYRLLEAAGLPVVSNQRRTVRMRFQVIRAGAAVASQDFSLTFGPSNGISRVPFPPVVAPVVDGEIIRISYDVSNVRIGGQILPPILRISQLGNVWHRSGPLPPRLILLTPPRGTIELPTSWLAGSGIYGFRIHLESNPLSSESEVAAMRYDSRPAEKPQEPRLAEPGTLDRKVSLTRTIDDSGFMLSYDSSNVPGGVNTALEVSFPGPLGSLGGGLFAFSNPNGNRPDAGVFQGRFGSVKWQPLVGGTGLTYFDANRLFDLGEGFGITLGHYNFRLFALDEAGQPLGSSSDSVSLRLDPPGEVASFNLRGIATGVAVDLLTHSAILAINNEGSGRPGELMVYDLASHSLSGTVPLMRQPRDVCVIPDINTAVVVDFSSQILVVDLTARRVRSTLSSIFGRRFFKVACNPATRTAVALGSISGSGATALVIDLNVDRITGMLDLPGYLDTQSGDVALNPTTNTALVLVPPQGNPIEDARLYFIDLRERSVTATLLLGRAANRLAVNPRTHQVVVTAPLIFRQGRAVEPAALMVIDEESRRPSAVIPLDRVGKLTEPGDVDINPNTNTAIVADRFNFRVAVVDLVSRKVKFSARTSLLDYSGGAVAFNLATDSIIAAGYGVTVFQTPRLRTPVP